MSQVKLTLRPPPNVDFVHGYPGVPPGGPDRPQAAVKGAIEVRAGPQGVKAKWLHIELRKVETLPGGGMSNTFYDSVGPSPVNLWTSSDEYGLLRTQDFPFSIRIPESIPPSIALENRAGIQYELIASLCTKGKKSFWRKRKSIVVSTQAAIIIDKHDLHSTWPVYCQPETRQHVQDGATLVVDRNQSCFGPGDRVSVIATFRSDSLEGPVLRGFELILKESTIFHTGHHGKKSVPQAKLATISDSKLAINSPLYVGALQRAELACAISPDHTTTSLNAARHIDVTYVLTVRAIVDGIQPIVLDLPIIVSNWQRNVSQEAIRRIGPAPGLSLIPITIPPPNQSISRVDPPPSRPVVASTLPISTDNYGISRSTSANVFNTLPSQNAGTYQNTPAVKVDEFGYGFSSKPTHTPTNSAGSYHQINEYGTGPTSVPATTTGVGRRPNSTAGSSRFTVTNALPSEIPQQEPSSRQRNGSRDGGSGSGSGSGTRGPWPTAEEEKQRLYEAAKAKVERVQGVIPKVVTPPSTPPPVQSSPGVARNGPWPSAEEEKLRLFNQAQAAAKKTQGLDSYPPPSGDGSDAHHATDLSRGPSTNPAPSNIKKQNSAAAIYTQAMSARNEALAGHQSTMSASPPKVPHYPTAEEEKAALRRYEQAKLAVDRTQNMGYSSEDAARLQVSGSAPIAYEHLYPNNKPSSSSSLAPISNDLPPPFEAPANIALASHLSEKERLRRAYQQQDAAARAHENGQSNDTPPPFPYESSTSNNQGLSEKEILRRKFAAQDAELNASAGRTSPPQPPPRSPPAPTHSPSLSGRQNRPTPIPPTSPGKILTAAEEKALLKAQYAARDARAKAKTQVNGNESSRPSSSGIHLAPPTTPPGPPPLMPRPPVEYIQETQEEDARVSKIALNGALPSDDGLGTKSNANAISSPLSVQTFSPFMGGFENIPPPPPLPPKPDED